MKVDVEDRAEICNMVGEGASPLEAAQEFGISVSVVYRILREAGMSSGKRGRRSVVDSFSPDDLEALIADYLEDAPMTTRELCKKWGITLNGLYSILAFCGVTPRTVSEDALKAKKARMDHAVQLYKDGVPLWKIRDETGVHQTTLHPELHRRGVQTRRGQR